MCCLLRSSTSAQQVTAVLAPESQFVDLEVEHLSVVISLCLIQQPVNITRYITVSVLVKLDMYPFIEL